MLLKNQTVDKLCFLNYSDNTFTQMILMEKSKISIVHNRLLRLLLLGSGFLALGLGTVGIFVPLLPTVPFLLLATACFARSSERFHNWLMEHPHFGPILHSYLNGQGISLQVKISTLALLWISIPISVLFFIDILSMQILLIGIGLGVTIHLLRLPQTPD